MKVEYVSNFQRNYIKIALAQTKEKKLRYQYQIVTTRRLEGFLPVTLHVSNGESSLYYDISSRQSLPKWLLQDKIGKDWMESFIAGLKTALWSMEQYLLDERNLLLCPDYIFQEVDSEQFRFLYVPYYQEAEKPEMERLLSFLVENADEREPETAGLLYELYADWERMQEAFTAEMLIVLWESRTTQELPDDRELQPLTEQDSEREPEAAGEEAAGRRELPGLLFGWHRRLHLENTKVAMETVDYRPQPIAEVSAASPAEAQTTYMEVRTEQEERKLFGNGRDNRRVIALEHLPLVIGKKEGKADIVLQDGSVSRLHARLTEEDGKIYLEDLNATNGTFQNGVRLRPYERVELLREDEVKVGNLCFTYR